MLWLENKLKPSPSSTTLNSWYEYCICIWFSPKVVLFIVDRHLNFGFVCQNDIVPKVSWLDEMQT